MSEYLDEIENQYELAETAAYFDISPTVNLVDPPKEKEGYLDTIGRASVKGVVKGMTETPNNLATIIGLPVDMVTAGLNKLGLDIQKPFMGLSLIHI